MRFERLELQAFGHFTDRSLAFGQGSPDFHMLLGANEAGKSTTLAAIADLLFGIERLSRYRFLHDNALMLGATIGDETGRRLTFRRRKGDKNTLLDENGDVLAESSLAALRGSDDRSFFTGMFGLDHERLRRGGEEMHSAKGDLGRSLFQAGAAVRGLQALLNRLEGDAAQLFSPQGRNPRINARLAEYRDIRQAMARAGLKGEAWHQHRAAADGIEVQLTVLAAERDQLMAERSRIERIHRILPLTARLREIHAGLANLAEAPLLPADAADRRLTAEEARRAARQALDSHQTELAHLHAQLRDLPPEDALLAEEQALEALRSRQGEIAKDLSDLPARRAELAQITALLAATLRELGSDLAVERAQDRILPRPKAAELRALITQAAENQADQRQTAEVLEEARLRLRQLEIEIAALPDAGDPAPLKDALREILKAGSPEEKLRDARQRLATAERSLERLLARIPFWQDDPARLGILALPSPERQRQCRDDIAAACQQQERLDRDRTAAGDDHDRAEAEIAALTRSGPVATEAAVTGARRQRDEHWRRIRRHFADGDRAEPLPPDLADRFEDALSLADSLADRVKGEAQRAARLEEAERTRLLAGQRLAKLEAQRTLARQTVAAAEQGWKGLCESGGLPVLSFEELQTLAAVQGQASDLIAQRDAAAEQAAAGERRLAEATDRLAALTRAAAGTPFADALALAEAQAGRAEEVAGRRRLLVMRRDGEKLALDQAQGRHALALQAGRKWRDAWAAALAPLGFDAGTGIAEAEAILGLADRLAELCRQQDGLLHRITAMEDDVAQFTAAVRRLLDRLAPELAERPILEALATLVARLQAARETRRRRQDLADAIARLQRGAEDAGAALAEAGDILEGLCRTAGCQDPDALPAAERRSAEKIRLTADHRDQEAALLAAGDGLDLEALAAEAESMAADAIPAMKEKLAARLAAIDEDRTRLTAERAGHQADLAAMTGESAAAAEAERAEQVGAALRDDAHRYMQLRLGQGLLRQVMDNYRKRHQGPLLEQGSLLFGRLTLGSFSGIDTGFDRNDTPILLARREDGRRLEVGDLSEGTRDQLFLALRLAAIEQHLAAGRRLPFIADDLLIHFDDDRAIAAIGVLAELSRRTQVIFFTHNRHMTDLAARSLAQSAVNFMTF